MNNHSTNNQQRSDLLGWLIAATVFLYVFAAYLVPAMPLFSRVNVVLAVMLACLLLCRLIANGRLSLPRYVVIPCLFLAFSAISMAWALSSSEAGWTVTMTSSAMLGALGVWVAVRNGLSWRTVAWACAVGAGANLIVGQSEAAAMGLGGRTVALAGNPNVLAMVLTYAALIIWCTPPRPVGSPRRELFGRFPRWGLHVLAVGFVAYAFLFTGSRKMLLVVPCVAFLALIHVLPRLKRPRDVLWLALGCWLAVAAFVLVDIYRTDIEMLGTAQSIQRMQDLASGKATSNRIGMIYEAIELWWLQPVAGYGPGQYAVIGSFQGYSHNNFTEVLFNFGVVGFTLFYLLHAVVLVSALRGIYRGSAPHRSAFVLVLTILLLDVGMVTYFAKVSWLFLVFAADLGTARNTGHLASTARSRGVWAMRRSPARLSSANWHRSRLHAR